MTDSYYAVECSLLPRAMPKATNASYDPIFTVRAWIEAPSYRIETDATDLPRMPLIPGLLHTAGSLAETTRQWLSAATVDEPQPAPPLRNKNTNSATTTKTQGGITLGAVSDATSGASTLRRHVIWGRESYSASVVMFPIDTDFIFAVRLATAAPPVASPGTHHCDGYPTLTEQEVCEFAGHALFVLTTDVPLHSIIPTGWLAGTAMDSGRQESVSLRVLHNCPSRASGKQSKPTTPTDETTTTTTPSNINNNDGEDAAASNVHQDPTQVRAETYRREVRKRLEVCCVWWLNQRRLQRSATTRLVETTSAALRASSDVNWIERLNFSLQSKFHLPFSVATSPLEWTPNNFRGGSGDTTTRFVEDGWLIMQDKHVIGASPFLDPAKHEALFHASTLVGSSVGELTTHLGDLCAAPSGGGTTTSSSSLALGGGGNSNNHPGNLSKPVIPPVVLFDLDITGWITGAPRIDSAMQPFCSAATGLGRQLQQQKYPFVATTTEMPGWQDTSAAQQLANNRVTRWRIVVASSAGGAFAPKGFSVACLLTSSHVPFVGIPLSIARDVTRAGLSEVSAMWEQYTSERAAQDIGGGGASRPEMRMLFEQYGLILHAVMCCSAEKHGGVTGSGGGGGGGGSGMSRSYLVSGGTAGAIRSSLGPASRGSMDTTLDGSRKMNEIIEKAQVEVYGSANNHSNKTTSCGVGIIPFHEEVLQQMVRSGILASYASAARRPGNTNAAAANSRQVFTLTHRLTRVEGGPSKITRRVLAVLSPEKGDATTVRVGVFSVPIENVSEGHSMHLGRLIPIH